MKFNLVTDPWIPVLIGSQRHILGLAEIFSKSEKISSVANDPAERFAIMRLLLCITQAALDGSADEADWKCCKDEILHKVFPYLKKWEAHFDLYGKYPFLQVAALQPIKNHVNSYLNPFFASGGNHTLFDPDARSLVERVISKEETAMSLLVSQIFAVCGLKCKPPKDGVKWGKKLVEAKGKAAIATNMLLTIIKNKTLLDTLHSNLINKEWLTEAKIDFGRPIWELDFDEQEGKVSQTAKKTYLYNLIPLSKGVLLDKDSNEISFSDGIAPCEYPVYRDPMGTVIVRNLDKKPEESYLKVNEDKSPWRDLQSILNVLEGAQHRLGPWAMRHFVNGNRQTITFTTGGFSYDKAKPKMTCEWQLKIPARMLGKAVLELYDGNVKKAEKAFNSSRYAFEKYLDITNMSYSDKKNQKHYQALLSKAERRFWFGLEPCASQMIDALAEDEKIALKQWGHNVYVHALKSFEESCGEYQKDLMSYTKALLGLKRSLKEVLQ